MLQIIEMESILICVCTDANEPEFKEAKPQKKSRRRQKPFKLEEKPPPPVESRDPQSLEKLSNSKEVRRKKGKSAAKKETTDSHLSCSTCHAEFGSRTKLFKHIKESGHAALKSDM